jgi:hypothetical protein
LGVAPDFEGLIPHRGPTWVTVRAPNGARRNIKRALTDLAQPLPDSKSARIVSIPVLLRILGFVEALSRRAEEEEDNDENDDDATAVRSSVAVAQAAGTDPAPAGGAARAGSAPATARTRRG